MQQPEAHSEHGTEHGAAHGEEGFNAGEVIIDHVANSSPDHPILHLPSIAGVDLSISKHVLMLWIVATIVFTAMMFAKRMKLEERAYWALIH